MFFQCGGIILKGSYTTGIKADVSVSTTRAFLPPYHVGKRGYTRLAHVSDTSTSHHDYMHIGLHANRQMQAYTNRQRLDGPCPIIWHEAISAVVWTYSQWSHMHKKISWFVYTPVKNIIFFVMMTKTPPTDTKKATRLWAWVSMLQWITAVAWSKYEQCALPSRKPGANMCNCGAHVVLCTLQHISRIPGCWTPRCIFQNICLTPGAMSSNWSRLNYTLFKAY